MLPIEGVESFSRSAPVSGPTCVDATVNGTRVRRGARLWTIAVSTFKTETYRFLRLVRPTDEEAALGVVPAAGSIHIPSWIDSEWCQQLVAEQLVTVRTRRGFSRLEWQKARERNEALDCRVYARAAAWIVGLDRMSEADWLSLEASVAAVGKARSDPVPAAPRPPPARRPQGRASSWV